MEHTAKINYILVKRELINFGLINGVVWLMITVIVNKRYAIPGSARLLNKWQSA
nr:hypothetical protein [Mucilaginibacter sp. FT3.2]